MTTLTSIQAAVSEIEHVWISMRDGTRLSARLWLPPGAEQSPVPAIIEYIPYRKRDLKRARDVRMHPYFAEHGFAGVRVDLRGSGDSEGVLEDEYLEQELEDAEDVLAWLAEQPWCDGQVGMIGISWGGFNGLQVAARRPPQLKAVIAVAASDDRYADDVHYMGGCLLNDNLSWASTMFAFNSMPPDPEVVGARWRDMWMQRLAGSGLWVATWMEHPHRDEYWRHASIREDYEAIECPVMIVSGWADGYSNPVFRVVEHLRAPCEGIVGPWSHAYPHMGTPGPQIGFLQECVRWWEQWLRGEHAGVEAGPKLRVWMQESVEPQADYRKRPGRWIGEPCWPSPNVHKETRALAPGRILDPGETFGGAPEPLAIQSPISVGLFAGKWCSYTGAPDLPYDQREEDGGSLVFDSRPLDTPLEILGAPELELDLSADRPVAMVAIRLSDLRPNDKATRVTYGLLNLCHRDGHAHPEPLEPGRRYRVRVPLNHIAQRFPAGHRLRLAISTSYWPLAWLPPEPVRLTVYAEGCRFTLPVRPPRPEEDARLLEFEEAVQAPPLKLTTIEPAHQNWLILRDLAGEESTLHVINDEGVYRIEEIDLTVEKKALEWYRFIGDDFQSIRGEVQATRGLRRGAWSARTVTHTIVTCTRAEFHIHATLDAYENGRRLYSQTWNRSLPRRCL
ncbi:MAG: CocE/NonD family hydrolase [Gammaproteobacteria bacterium]|nr:CocE/NonD family hydrolase [Gammaproteobacteria bacterium]